MPSDIFLHIKLLEKANKTPQNYTSVHATVKIKNEFSTVGSFVTCSNSQQYGSAF